MLKGTMQGKRAYRIKEATGVLGISRSLLYRIIQEGRLRVVKIGSCTLILSEDLETLLREGLKQAPSAMVDKDPTVA